MPFVTPWLVPIYETSTGQLLSRKLSVFCQTVLARGLLDETVRSMAQKILIVEDSSDLSQLLASYLSNAGYEISRARNLAEGISKALAERPDLIITDLHLQI